MVDSRSLRRFTRTSRHANLTSRDVHVVDWVRIMASVGTCIECGARLAPVLAIEERGTPHGEAGHHYAFSERTLSRCAAGHGQLESYSHDCWSHDEDRDLYWWFLLSETATAELLALARSCPRP